MSSAIKPEEVEQAAKGHLALEPIELEVRNLMVITLEGMGDGLSAGDSGDDGDGGRGGSDHHGELDLWGEISFMPGVVPHPCRTPDIE